MRAKLIPAITALVATMLAVAPVMAITGGSRDYAAHPYVGVVVFYGAGGNAVGRCSGELLTTREFLTAGHCITLNNATSAEVWFDEQASTQPGSGQPGTVSVSADGELGAVTFALPVSASSFVGLPAVGVVDTLVNKSPLTIVGYGVTEQDKVSGNPITRWNNPTDRVSGPSALVSGTQASSADLLKHQNGPGGDSVGGCFHDSGGPVLNGTSNVVLAINAYVNNGNCTGIGYGTRIDTAAHLAFIASLP